MKEVSGYVPGAGLAHPYPGSAEILLQPLVVLDQTAEFELRHRLLLGSGVHFGKEGGGERMRRKETRVLAAGVSIARR